MRKFFVLIISLILTYGGIGQNSDPYKIFGHTTKVKYEIKHEDMLYIKNADTSSHIKSLAFDRLNNIAILISKDGSIKERIKVTPENVFRWMSVDPKADKFAHASPYNFVENNPIIRIDPDGADWIVSTFKGKDGNTQIKLTFAGAIMNSSGQKFDIKKMIANEVKTFEKVFGQGNVHANLQLREIKSADELKWHESLIDIQSSTNFKSDERGYTGGDAIPGGKFIRINAQSINEQTSVFKDAKTLVHEIGHTGGLVHPWQFDDKTKQSFVNSKPFSVGVQPFSNQTLVLDANFMGYTSWAIEQGSINMMLSDNEKKSYFMNNVGKATQGQVQQILNNLWNGKLNSDNDIPKKKR